MVLVGFACRHDGSPQHTPARPPDGIAPNCGSAKANHDRSEMSTVGA